MASKQLRLVYPPSLLDKPVLNQLMKDTPITINIIRANISLEEGWLEINLMGTRKEILKAESWLEKQGLQIISISPEEDDNNETEHN